ncbi:MAG: amidohydrolase family protein [Rhodobacteraceae bacterium]|nr:amidohydrolase family protein [Paracoccaceae bacterium]
MRDGAMVRRSIALRDGRLTTGPFPAVDLTGYYVMPGVVDLHSTSFQHLLSGETPDLALIDREAASHGVTTRFLAQPWSWERESTSPEAAAQLGRALIAYRRRSLTDLRLALSCERIMVADEDALLDLVDACAVGQVVFSNRAETAADLLRNDPDAFAQWAWTWGTRTERLEAALRRVLPQAASVPRHLCRLAEAFDARGVIYGSHGDQTAETREHYSMIGAGLCLSPGTARVAAAARAVGDPVLACAEDVLSPAPQRRVARTTALIDAGLCDALVSDRHSASPVQAAFRLTELGLLPLERAWALIAEKPAEILRLPDRGVLAPGKRADLVIIHAETRQVEATICGGRLTFMTGEAAARFLGVAAEPRMAAE